MEAHIQDWLNLLFRWFHIITGIAWIGASFYFNWLENQLDRRGERNRDEIAGHLWAVHGGGFYYLEKFKVAPEKLPETLHWFKWEAYFTWITGVVLLVLVYYLNAEVYLIDPRVADLSIPVAVTVGFGSMALAWVAYDLLCKSPLATRPVVLATVGFGLLILLSFVLTQLFGGRGAYIHVGAAIGTIMVANVFFVIIPSQRDLVAAVEEGRQPDGSRGKAGLLRSRHNNYLTLPVLFIMISNHYPNTYAHEWNWLILAIIMLGGAGIRHYFNVRHVPGKKVWILPAAASLMLVAFVATMPQYKVASDPEMAGVAVENEEIESVSGGDIRPIIEQRCLACHAAGIATGGINLEDEQNVQRLANRIHRVVVEAESMPPGNATGITDEERAQIDRWFRERGE